MPRLQAKNFFLTYPQAEAIESKEYLRDKLKDLVPPPSKVLVAKELHEDGGTHYHVLLHFPSKLNTTNMRFFDVAGRHPNIIKPRSTKDTITYICKDGDYINQGWDLDTPDEDPFTVVTQEIENGTNPTVVIACIMNRLGTKGLKMYSQIAAYVDRVMRPSSIHYPVKRYPDDFHGVDDRLGALILKFLTDVAAGPMAGRAGRRSLWIYGASRLGKTYLARSLGVHWYMCNSWNVRSYDDEAEYGVLDDISWDNLKRYYKGLMGMQRNITVSDKYEKKKELAGGRPVIVLSNSLPVFDVEEASWLQANVNFYLLTQKVYDDDEAIEE